MVLQLLMEYGGDIITHVINLFDNGLDTCVSLYNILNTLSMWEILTQTYIPFLVIIPIGWPIILSLIMTIGAASSWFFFLLTSVCFGIVQLIYVSYQFTMVLLDIVGLSVLKTFAMLRSQIRYFTIKSGLTKKRSRRREWRRQVDKATTYEDFLKIYIEPKIIDISSDANISNANSSNVIDAALPKRPSDNDIVSIASSPEKLDSLKIKKSNSFGNAREYSLKKLVRTNTKSFNTREEVLTADLLEKELGITGGILLTTTERLHEARKQASNDGTDESMSSVKYLLSGVVKRNHLTIEDMLIENSRSVAESGKYGLSAEARHAIQGYYKEVEKTLDWIAEAPLQTTSKTITSNTTNHINKHNHHNNTRQISFGLSGGLVESLSNNSSSDFDDQRSFQQDNELADRITLVRKMKQNMGRTALMLSGGGAQAMYHAGTVRALIDSKIYDDIAVVSGTSGGSIIAAMCAMKTSDELYKNVCVNYVSTDYTRDGRMKKENIRWFPTNMEMASYWLKNKLLVDSADFKRCCDYYYGDTTFEEAFERTGKNVCITVSASRASGGTAQRLLLNHISTPHVTLASAVAASCALPGVMAPTKLLSKDSKGEQTPFEVDGVEWIDGSVQADLPFQRISTLFNVSNYVVCQTNFHVVPFLNKAHHPNRNSTYWRLFQTMEWDIRSRALKLSRLGLFPRMFGQDISKVFKQKYHGNLTLVPRFTTMQTFGLKALANPNVEDMNGYLKYGQIAAWPHLNTIRNMIRLERALDDCLARLDERMRLLSPNVDWPDDVDSLVSSSFIDSSNNTGHHRVRFGVPSREAERLKKKVMTLEDENTSLRQQLEDLQKMLLEQQQTQQRQDQNEEDNPAAGYDEEENASTTNDKNNNNNNSSSNDDNRIKMVRIMQKQL